MRLFVPTASKNVVATMQSLFFLLCSSGLCVTNCLVWRVYLHSTRVTATQQTFICHPFLWSAPLRVWHIVFHFSDFGLSLHPVLHIQILFFQISIWQSVWVVAWWMEQQARGCGCCSPAKYLNWRWWSESIKRHQFSRERLWKYARDVTTSTVPPNS